MVKSEFIQKVAQDANAPLTRTTPWVNAVLDSLVDAIITEDEVHIAGLGRFTHVARKARQGRNASNGEPVYVPAHTGVKFKPSGRIKQEVAPLDAPEPKNKKK